MCIYTDGTKDTIGTGESWCVRRSNITFSNLYDGEVQDDTLGEMPIEIVWPAEEPKRRADRAHEPSGHSA